MSIGPHVMCLLFLPCDKKTGIFLTHFRKKYSNRFSESQVVQYGQMDGQTDGIHTAGQHGDANSRFS